ncbi:MAG TPA: CAP domain-containing protein [Micropepsaceae bacterium]|nr:CAP domain-containing protein [Micropepsaceae bacterium]
MTRLGTLLVAFALAACASAPVPKAPPSLEVQVGALKERLFVLVEAERHRLNDRAKPLILDPELMRAAQTHSEDMAKKRSFDVGNPDGNLAVNTLLADPKFRGFVGENSAAQYFTPRAGFDPDTYARGFLDIWLKSPDHRTNLMYEAFDKTGIGIAVNGDAIYAAELFATDLGLPEPQ